MWLQALSTPPKQARLQPLAERTSLREGRYEVVRKLGAGGQGNAYLCKSDKGTSVVLKEYIFPVYVDISVRRQALERFEKEARLLSAPGHPRSEGPHARFLRRESPRLFGVGAH